MYAELSKIEFAFIFGRPDFEGSKNRVPVPET
jgi:hypothetical protein